MRATKATPSENLLLFDRIEQSRGAMIWPFPDGTETNRGMFLTRNRWLAALSELVVVIQARASSGSLHAAGCAEKIGKPVRVVQPPAWADVEFAGSREWLRTHREKPIASLPSFLTELGLSSSETGAASAVAAQAQLVLELGPRAATLLESLTKSPQHLDHLAESAAMAPGEVATLLLTLSLENVVVEGPSGFYRRS